MDDDGCKRGRMPTGALKDFLSLHADELAALDFAIAHLARQAHPREARLIEELRGRAHLPHGPDPDGLAHFVRPLDFDLAAFAERAFGLYQNEREYGRGRLAIYAGGERTCARLRIPSIADRGGRGRRLLTNTLTHLSAAATYSDRRLLPWRSANWREYERHALMANR